MTGARRLALAFGAAHVAVCAAGLVEPRAYGLGTATGPRSRRRLRALAAVDAVFAGSVAAAAVRGRPLRRRLLLGAGSDVGRAVALLAWIPADGRPNGRRRARRSRVLLVAASLAGASTATVLSGRVDLPTAGTNPR